MFCIGDHMINGHRVVLITGARRGVSRSALGDALASHNISGKDIILHGNCSGVDQDVAELLNAHGIYACGISALWDFYRSVEGDGRHAGPSRNIYMITTFEPDLVLAFPTASSKGTRHCITVARTCGCEVVVHEQ
jgi:hypothetical protein